MVDREQVPLAFQQMQLAIRDVFGRVVSIGRRRPRHALTALYHGFFLVGDKVCFEGRIGHDLLL